MFLKQLTTTPLTNEDANTFFEGKIDGDAFMGDTSFLATVRAMVYDRMGDDKMKVRYAESSYDTEALTSISETAIFRAIFPVEALNGDAGIYVHNFSGRKADCDAWFAYVKEKFLERYGEDFIEIPRVEAFFKKVIDIVCFVNKDAKISVIYVNNMDKRRMHYIQCGMPVFLPWYFTDMGKITEDDLELVKSLQLKSEKRYLEILTGIASRFDFLTAKIRRCLEGFENKFEQDKLASYRGKSVDVMSELSNYQEHIDELLMRKREIEDIISSLEMKIESGGDSELMEYFLSNKALYLDKVEGPRITFVAKTYIEYFDEDLADTMIGNYRSCLYEALNSDTERENARKVLTAIFIDQTLKVKTCAAYSVRSGGGVSALSGYDFDEYLFGDRIPNTHINRYSCLGNHQRIINQLLEKYDYVGAVEQCVSSCKSLNFADSTVMREFCYDFFRKRSVNNVCIELPNGDTVDWKGALKYLEESGEAKEGEE